MKQIILNIKGRDWAFMLIPDRKFDKLYNQNDEGNIAMTLVGQYTVHFRKSDWCTTTIRHEIFHVLYAMDHNVAADLSPLQVEETCCEIMARNYNEIGLWSDRIAENFFGRD
jgi:hypothetical protein